MRRKQPIILRLIRDGKPEGECSMSSLARQKASLRKRRIILCNRMRKNKNLCMRYKAKLPER